MSTIYETRNTTMHAVIRRDATDGPVFTVRTYVSIAEPTPEGAVFAYLDKGRADAKAAELNRLGVAA